MEDVRDVNPGQYRVAGLQPPEAVDGGLGHAAEALSVAVASGR